MMNMVMGKIDIAKHEGDDRALAIHITLKHEGMSTKELDAEMDKVIDYMESNVDDCEFVRCPDEDEGYITDAFYIDFEYGTMGKVKKEINKEWQSCKKALGYC